ncbi:MAG: hypothetical protein LBV33_06025, partial [Lachnospiraceae bacterium]|nr:hypothetical protein [Lachnospiraceae bacterium]
TGTSGNSQANDDSKVLKGKDIYGPHYEDAVKLHKEKPEWYPDPDESIIVDGEELIKAREEYKKMYTSGALPKGHHRQGLAFGGGNTADNIQFTGESTIASSEVSKAEYDAYVAKSRGKKDPKTLKIHKETEEGEYVLGSNPNHTEVTNFQNKVMRWQRKAGLRKKNPTTSKTKQAKKFDKYKKNEVENV